MHSGRKLALILALSASLAVSLGMASAQTSGGNGGSFNIPGGLVPDDNVTGPVANVGAQYKFDDGFYQKIQNLILEEPQAGDYGVYDGERYYNVIIVVSRDDGDSRDPDEVARENKNSIVQHLNTLGARDIVAAESLSFVTASIPVAEIPGFSSHDEIYAMGDGELPVVVEADTARQTIRATPSDLRQSIRSVPSGTGVVVAVVDTGINNIYLNSKVIDRIYCNGGCKAQPNGIIVGLDKERSNSIGRPHYDPAFSSHGTRVAQVLAASDMGSNNGIATEVTLLDAMYGQDIGTRNFLGSLAHAIDWSYSRGADVVNISAGDPDISCSENSATSYNMIINEAVDKGMVVVKSAGNKGYLDSSTNYRSITPPGCAHNVITVGGINDRNDPPTMYINSSRGSISDSDKRLAPHIVAPAVNIQTLDFPNNDTMSNRSGTSYAAAQVSATAAMMLQVNPELTTAEVKAALLLGADWKGPIPCTSLNYEQNAASSNCSYIKQPRNIDDANNAASLGILNNAGFGILDTTKSLYYVNSDPSYVISDHLDSNTTSKSYKFEVDDLSKPVKVILTWMVHPHGNITEQLDRSAGVPVADLNFEITKSRRSIISASSSHQTTEFAVFNPSRTGDYTIKVQGSGLDSLNKPVQTFALASTSNLTAYPLLNHPPVAQPNEITVSPGLATPVRLSATDRNGDVVSFHVSSKPAKGTITASEIITESVSRAIYTPDDSFTGTDTFEITPHDGTRSGTPATITLRAESLPSGATEVRPESVNVRDWDTGNDYGFIHTDYTEQFAGKSYPVSALHVGSVNMEGVSLAFDTGGGARYTVAIPSNGTRMIEFATPITIRNATLSADAIDEETAHHNRVNPSDYKDVRMFVGYVPGSCSAAGASGAAGASSCPAQATYTATAEPGLTIPDNTGSQGAVSAMQIPEYGTITALSISVNIDHGRIGDLKVILTPPDGTEITLHNRAGGTRDDIDATYSLSSGKALAALAGSKMGGTWRLSVGDYSNRYAGTLEDWSISVTYTPQAPGSPEPVAIFSDDFQSASTLTTKWTESGDGDWRTSTTRIHGVPALPGQSASNRVLHSDDCDTSCTLVLKNPIDLTGYTSATLSLWRFVDRSLDRGEYLRVGLYDGSSWTTIHDWTHGSGNDDTWHHESYDLASYLDSSAFKLRLVTRQSLGSEDVQLDDITITATPAQTSAPVAPDTQKNARQDRPVSIKPGIDDSLTITAATGATKGVINTDRLSSGVILYTARQTGIDTITYTVRDGRGGTAEGTITTYNSERGNTRPALGTIHDTGTNTGRALTFTAAASDANDDPLTFGIANAPDGAAINSATGFFSWTPIPSQSGTHVVTIIVHDDRGGAAWQDVTITVLPAGQTNRPPVPEDITTTAIVGEAKTFQPVITDPDGDDTVIISVSDASTGTVLDAFISDGILIYVGSGLGSEEFTYTASDRRGGTATGTIRLTVVAPANISPTLGLVGDRNINALQRLAFTATATDIDSTTLTFGLRDEPAGARITPQGAFSWTPAEAQEGRHVFTVIVSDDAGGNDTETITVNVRDRDFVNSAPVAPDVVAAVSQNTPRTIRPPISDPNGDPVIITAASGATKGDINTGFLRAGIVVYRPNPGQTGIDTITYTVSDGSTMTATGTITVFISQNGNRNPVLAPIGFRNINAGERLTFDIMARDRDPLSYLLAGAPAGAQVSAQGRFSWTPAATETGNHTFTIAVYDNRGGAISEVVTVRVLPAGTANGNPTAPPVTITVGTGSSTPIAPEIGDPDGDQVSITGATGNAGGTIIPSADSILYIAGTTPGSETVTYTVTDIRGASSTGTITITIH